MRIQQRTWRHVRSTRRLRQSDLNIRPIMNLFMLLVPFLLMYASFVEISILHSAITSEGGRHSEGIKPGLILRFEESGFTLMSRTCDLKRLIEHQEKVAGSATLKIDNNLEQLRQYLATIKEHFATDNEITLIPKRATAYQEVIRTMDVVRLHFPNIAFMTPRDKP